MKDICVLQDIEEVLNTLTEQTTTGMLTHMTLDRVVRLAEVAGSPHERLRVVHVAGTSGKTSTSYMTAHLLRKAGKKVGLTVSPGVVSILEWVQLSDELLHPDEFSGYFSEFYELTKGIDFTPTRFEYLMVFSLWVFDKEGVDYAVIETGLGGLMDASNICRRANKLCVITDIGFDHEQILGSTLSQITQHKAGIIAPGNTVIMYRQGDEVMSVCRSDVLKKGAKLVEIEAKPSEIFTRRNARLSYETYRVIAKRDGLPIRERDVAINKTVRLAIPGRLYPIEYRGKTVLLDGAHNQQKMQALRLALESLHPATRWSAVYSMKADKNYKVAIAEIAPLLERVIVAPLKTTGTDMQIESVPPKELCAEFRTYGVMVEIASSVETGLDSLIEKPGNDILVTGSLYAVSEVMSILNEV